MKLQISSIYKGSRRFFDALSSRRVAEDAVFVYHTCITVRRVTDRRLFEFANALAHQVIQE